MTRDYKPAGPVVRAFHRSNSFVRGIRGPIGSGKSTACVIEILRRAQMQERSPDGIRRTKWVVIRNSYPELKSTTIRTWQEWCPPQYGRVLMDSPIIHHIKCDDLDMEVMFLALDKEDDVRKLLSLEVTGAWVNEAREVQKPLIDALTGRVGRYPSMVQGGASWSGIIMDTNPPDTESWWFKFAEQETPEGWEFFSQPSGLSPEAENIANLPGGAGYYTRLAPGKDDDWRKAYIDGEYAFLQEGKPVYSMWRDSYHMSPTPLEPAPGIALTLGVDFGLTPAAVIMQTLVDGRNIVLSELTTDNTGVKRFGELLVKHVRSTYPDHDVGVVYGDPAGGQRSQTDERTALEILREVTSWRCKPAPSNDLTMRLEAVINALNRNVDGKPGLLVSPRAAMLRKGFAGGYCYRPIRTGVGGAYHDTPAKNMYSHIHDSLQYSLLGSGEGEMVMSRVQRRQRSGGSRIAHGVEMPWFDQDTGPTHSSRRRDPMPGERGYRGSWR
jgi:hypothetical protein